MKQYILKSLMALVVLITLSVTIVAQHKNKDPFTIIAFGDMPYNLPQDYARFENVIKTVNELHQSFNVFVGDFKSSSTPCSEENYQKMFDYFQQFEKPLIYTPGDNEWTDCGGKKAGSYDPEERLEVIRKMFFNKNEPFGKTKLPFIAQSQQPKFVKYVENKRWNYHGIAFATIHIVGSNNFFLPDSKNGNKEFYERDEANIAWLKETFADAKKNHSLGIILFIHADMFTADKGDSGFKHIVNELKRLTIDFGKQVLLVNGDSHMYIVHKPFLKLSESETAIPNLTRLQVPGEGEMHAVKININPTNPKLFQIEQLIIEANK